MCHYILLKAGGKCKPADLDTIECFIAEGSYTNIYFSDGTKSRECGYLGLWEDRVKRKSELFVRIDNSVMVNYKTVKEFTRAGGLVFKSGKNIALSPKGYIALVWFFEWGASAEEAEEAGKEPPAKEKEE